MLVYVGDLCSTFLVKETLVMDGLVGLREALRIYISFGLLGLLNIRSISECIFELTWPSFGSENQRQILK